MEKLIVKLGKEGATAPRASDKFVRRLGDVMLFICVVALSCLAIIAVAIAAPFVLAASAVAGLFVKGGAQRGWRPAGA